MTRLCFVCMGNICRSPMAEGVFKHLAEIGGLSDRFYVESAGTGPWHIGEPPDPRAQRAALAHGLRLDGTARQLKPRDFARFDVLLALDEEVAADLKRLAPTEQARKKVRLLRAYDPLARGERDVPDPYYGGPADFEQAYQMIARSCQALLKELSTDGTDKADEAA